MPDTRRISYDNQVLPKAIRDRRMAGYLAGMRDGSLWLPDMLAEYMSRGTNVTPGELRNDRVGLLGKYHDWRTQQRGNSATIDDEQYQRQYGYGETAGELIDPVGNAAAVMGGGLLAKAGRLNQAGVIGRYRGDPMKLNSQFSNVMDRTVGKHYPDELAEIWEGKPIKAGDRLKDIMPYHPAYEDHPFLANIPLTGEKGGTYFRRPDMQGNPARINLEKGYADAGDLIHEFQHAIGSADGFLRGGTPISAEMKTIDESMNIKEMLGGIRARMRFANQLENAHQLDPYEVDNMLTDMAEEIAPNNMFKQMEIRDQLKDQIHDPMDRVELQDRFDDLMEESGYLDKINARDSVTKYDTTAGEVLARAAEERLRALQLPQQPPPGYDSLMDYRLKSDQLFDVAPEDSITPLFLRDPKMRMHRAEHFPQDPLSGMDYKPSQTHLVMEDTYSPVTGHWGLRRRNSEMGWAESQPEPLLNVAADMSREELIKLLGL